MSSLKLCRLVEAMYDIEMSPTLSCIRRKLPRSFIEEIWIGNDLEVNGHGELVENAREVCDVCPKFDVRAGCKVHVPDGGGTPGND